MRVPNCVSGAFSVLKEFIGVVAWCFFLSAKALIRNLLFFWPRPYKDISHEVVLITGGGRGVGRYLAMEFAKHKPKQIILWGRNEDMLNATASAVKLSKKVPCDYMICDVSKREEVYEKAELLKSKYGNVSILVNNAGMVSGFDVLDNDPEKMLMTINTNLMSHIWTSKAFLPSMMQSNHGHIVSINSVLGLMPLPGAADYCASKYGVTAFMENLAFELASEGYSNIITTSIHPYIIDTPMFTGISTRFPALFPPLHKGYVAWKSLDAILTNSPQILLPRIQYFLLFFRSFMPVDAMMAIQKFAGVDTCMHGFYARRQRNKQSKKL
ncbi:hypothetical protein CAPTEDRAFT_172468 [Capitella teleta]|uniref:Short-chain dehydrogenase/reductase 3 n=1 Tax=Capitella teleta TaxID=283909 RepID=R7TU48_CAPTE|nr:hypothetical protein CAPTEDRAFT_172468 [Capitella teleta]|eukprot:ELT97199.1 hypothetical protein CAPTEDRAFT_172468 [Capitella teleta]